MYIHKIGYIMWVISKPKTIAVHMHSHKFMHFVCMNDDCAYMYVYLINGNYGNCEV